MDYLIRQLRKSHHKSDENGRETTKEVSKSRRKLWYRRVFCFGNCGAKNKPLLNESYEDICLPELSKANVTPIVYTDGSSGNADLEIKKEDRIVQVRSTLEHTMEDITPPLAPNKTASKTETDVDENISLSLPPPFPKGRSKSMRTKHSEDFREEYSMAINNGWKNASFRSNKNNDEYFLPLNTNLNKPTKEINVEEELAISCFQPVHICRNNSMPRKLNENLKGGHIAIRDEPGNVDICSENKCKQYLPPNTNIRDTATWVDVNATHPAVSEIQKSNMGIFYSSFQSIPNTNLAVLPKNPNANPPLFMNEKYGSVILNGITANGVVDILEISQNANIPNGILLCHSQNLMTDLFAIDQDYESLTHCHLIKEGNDDSETKETNVSQALINYKSYGSRSENVGCGSASEECGGVFLIEQCIPLKPSQAIHLNESYILTSKDEDIVPTEGKCDQVVLPIHNGYYQNRTESVENEFGVGDSSEGLLVPPVPNLQIPTAAKGDVGMTHFVKFTFPQIPTQDNIVSTIDSDESVTLQHNGNNRAKTEGVDRGMVTGDLNEEFLLPCDLNFEKHLLVIDLDETLVHSSFEEIPNADFVVPVEINGIISQVYVAKRPYVDEFLQKMKPLYDCVLFTASQAKYADPVIDLLDKSGVFNARLFREACVLYRGYYVKDLSKFGRSLERIIIIDNSPACYYFHPENAVSVRSWFNDTTDTELLDLIPFFERLANIKNVYDVLPISKRRLNMTPHL